jgi:hypothetical protein
MLHAAMIQAQNDKNQKYFAPALRAKKIKNSGRRC